PIQRCAKELKARKVDQICSASCTPDFHKKGVGMKSKGRVSADRKPSALAVRQVSWKTPRKQVRLSDGRVLPLSISTCIGVDDEVRDTDGAFSVRCHNGDAKILPLYLAQDTLVCGAIVIPVKIKEIETAQEFEAFQQLSEFHYRGQRLHGRT